MSRRLVAGSSGPSLSLSLFSTVIISLSLSRAFADQLNCSVALTVDKTSTDGERCNSSTANRTCSDLQSALVSLSRLEISAGDCADVLVREGEYVISDFVTISGRNVRLRGKGSVTVRFNFSGKFDPRRTSVPHYVLSLFNAESVVLSGIDFTDSPGIITVSNVSSVQIEDCSFRYCVVFYQSLAN